MLSTIPNFCSAEPGPINPFPAFETGLPPWDCSELFFAIQSFLKPTHSSPGCENPSPHPSPGDQEPETGLENANPVVRDPSPGSDEPSHHFKIPKPDGEASPSIDVLNLDFAEFCPQQTGSNRSVETADGRKRKRPLSDPGYGESDPSSEISIPGFEIPSPDFDDGPASATTGFLPSAYISGANPKGRKRAPIGLVGSANGSASDPDERRRNLKSSFGTRSGRTVQLTEERERRMLSNRESARRSRLRRQHHLENLRNDVQRLREENRQLMNRLRFTLYQCHLVQTENQGLRSENCLLHHRLRELQRVLIFRQIQEHQQQQMSLQ